MRKLYEFLSMNDLLLGLVSVFVLVSVSAKSSASESVIHDIKRKIALCADYGNLAAAVMVARQKGMSQKELITKIWAIQTSSVEYETSLMLIKHAYTEPVAPSKDLAVKMIRGFAYGEASGCLLAATKLDQ